MGTSRIRPTNHNWLNACRQHHPLPLFVPAAQSIGWDIENSWISRTLDDIAGISPDSYGLIGLGIAALGSIKLTEAVGLWLAKR